MGGEKRKSEKARYAAVGPSAPLKLAVLPSRAVRPGDSPASDWAARSRVQGGVGRRERSPSTQSCF